MFFTRWQVWGLPHKQRLQAESLSKTHVRRLLTRLRRIKMTVSLDRYVRFEVDAVLAMPHHVLLPLVKLRENWEG